MGGGEAVGTPSVGAYGNSGGGGIGGGWGGAGGSGWLGWLRLRKCRIRSAGTPAEASASSSPLPVMGEAVIWLVFHRNVTFAFLGRGGWGVQEAGTRPSGFRGLACLQDVAKD